MSLTDVIRRHPLRALLVLALLLGLSFQGTRGLWEPDEGRYTNVALQMLHGGDFITLRRNETELHFTKPPLTYWTIAASVAALGRHEWAVRLPNALAYVLTVLLVFRLGRQFVPEKPWLPALIYASCPLPFFAANTINTDSMLALMETLAVTCYAIERFGGGRARWLDAMWVGFGLAFLTKGPPGLLPLLVILVFEVAQGRAMRLLRPLGLLGFVLVGLGWYAVVIQRHPGLLDYFLGHEVYARIATAELRRFPEWYGPLVVYLPTLLFGTLPWWLMAAWRQWRRPVLVAPAPAPASGWRGWPAEKRFLLVWLLLPLTVFCLSRSRLPLYILPLFLPLCLLFGRALVGMRWRPLGVALLALWLVGLLGLKYAMAVHYPTDKDARVFAARLEKMLPGHPEHVMFVEDTTRNGLNLYFDSDVQRLSFSPQPKRISDSPWDRTVAEALALPQRGRIFVFKLEVEALFLEAAKRAGKTPLKLGVLPDTHARLVIEDGRPVYRFRTEWDRVVYTLAGDFPVAGPVRRD